MLATKKWIGSVARCGGRVVRVARQHGPVGLLPGLLLAGSLLTGCREDVGHQDLRRGIRWIEVGQPQQAIEPLTRAAQHLATNELAAAQALNYLGLAYHGAGRAGEAASAYESALNRDLNLFAARFNRGCLWLEQGRVPDAIRELSTFTTYQPREPRGWLMLGIAQWRAGRYADADVSFREVTRLSSSAELQARALNGAGLCQAGLGRPDEALRFFGAAHKLDPRFAAPVLNEAILLESFRKDDLHALERYQAYLDLARQPAERERVQGHAHRLAMALRPALPSTGSPLREEPGAVEQITNLFARVGTVTVTPPTEAPSPVEPPPARTESPAVPAASPVGPEIAGPATEEPAPEVAAVEVERGADELPADPAARADVPPEPAEPRIADVAAVPEAIQAPLEGLVEAVAEVRFEEVRVAEPMELMVAGPALPLPPPGEIPPEPDAPVDSTSVDVPDEPPGADMEEPRVRERRSFFSRINPLNLVRRKETDAGRVTPIRPPAASPPEETQETPDPDPAGEAPPEVATVRETPSLPPLIGAGETVPTRAPAQPARPVYARYQYESPPRPETGDPAAARRHFLRGVEAYREGRLEAAAQAYDQAIRADPSHVEARYNLAALAFEQQRVAAALREYERVLAINPEHAAARYNFALALGSANHPLDAVVELNRLLERHPDHADAHLVLGTLLANQLGDPAGARLHYERVLQLEPRHPQATTLRRWLAAHRNAP